MDKTQALLRQSWDVSVPQQHMIRRKYHFQAWCRKSYVVWGRLSLWGNWRFSRRKATAVSKSAQMWRTWNVLSVLLAQARTAWKIKSRWNRNNIQKVQNIPQTLLLLKNKPERLRKLWDHALRRYDSFRLVSFPLGHMATSTAKTSVSLSDGQGGHGWDELSDAMISAESLFKKL